MDPYYKRSRTVGPQDGYGRYVRPLNRVYRVRARMPWTPRAAAFQRRARSYRPYAYGRFGSGRGQGAQIEKKFYDTALTLAGSGGAASSTNGNGQLLVGMAQGTTASTRIGQKIVVKSIQIKLGFTLAAGAVDTDIHHVYLVQDTQCNGTQAAIADVFINSGDMGLEMRTMENGARFKILKHFVVRLNADAGVAAAFGGDYQQEECFIKTNIPVTYNAAAGAIAEIKTNHLFLVYGSSNGTATVAGNARIRYTDR